jgi:hypothetical protein
MFRNRFRNRFRNTLTRERDTFGCRRRSMSEMLPWSAALPLPGRRRRRSWRDHNRGDLDLGCRGFAEALVNQRHHDGFQNVDALEERGSFGGRHGDLRA